MREGLVSEGESHLTYTIPIALITESALDCAA